MNVGRCARKYQIISNAKFSQIVFHSVSTCNVKCQRKSIINFKHIQQNMMGESFS